MEGLLGRLKMAEYTKQALRDRLKNRLMAGTKGGKAGQWSARKAQLLALAYAKGGGGYKGSKSATQKSMSKWTSEEWQTRNGEPAIGRGKGGKETARYLPKERWAELSESEAKATDQKKRIASRSGTQFVGNTEKARATKDSAMLASDRFTPPEAVATEARRGLDLRRKHGRGGTPIGVSRAATLSNRKSIGLPTLRRMHSYFSRHIVDKQGDGWSSQTRPSAGKIAWLLWGGDAGAAWVRGIRKQAIESGVW
jgi:hypothetical protein